ncbi:unnamed protein product [Echinostoma caproni]|uniref:Nipped-B protein n=1 Tax=Echinostoma caproni TaxID=27848 RepID=A0A183AGZ1_9TREM|nr:unnamed protein product [Echinostoma caproni]
MNSHADLPEVLANILLIEFFRYKVLGVTVSSSLTECICYQAKESTNTDAFLDEIVDTLILFAEYAAAPSVGNDKTTFQQMTDADLCRKAIMGIGFLVCRHDRLLCDKHVSTFFAHFFTVFPSSSPTTSPGTSGPGKFPTSSSYHEVQCIILDNLTHYLMDSERQMLADSKSWSARHKSESLKELADQRSGHGSAVAQEYLPLVLKHCILTQSLNVRTSALGLLSVILRQGLVHPVQTLSYLICLQTDPDTGNRSRATHLLAEAERKVPGFMAMRAASGVQLSYQLHLLLFPSGSHRNPNQSAVPLIRGATIQDNTNIVCDSGANACPVALNHAIYSMLRTNRQSRRSFISSLLSLFDIEQNKQVADGESSTHQSNKPSLGQLVFVADQLAHFPYSVLDEVLFIAYHIEQRLSVSGSSLIRLVQHSLLSSILRTDADLNRPKKETVSDKTQAETRLTNLIEAAETKLLKMERHSESSSEGTNKPDWDQGGKLHSLFEQASHSNAKARQAMISQGPVCWLLLTLRQHLRDIFGVTDSKLKDYSPSDSPKQWERPIVAPKRSPNGNHILRLPTLVVQCLSNPGWLHSNPVPPDTVILYQFIRLRHQLLALEDSSPLVGFLSPTPTSELPNTSATVKDERNEKSISTMTTNGEPITHSTKTPSPNVQFPTEKVTNSSPGHSRSSKREIHRSLTDHHRTGESSRFGSECSRNVDASAVSHSVPRPSTKTDAPSTSKTDHRHTEKSHTRKRRPRSSSISSLSSFSSSDVSSTRSGNRSQSTTRHSTSGTHLKTPHTPAKQSRVVAKTDSQITGRLSTSTRKHSKPSARNTPPLETSESRVPQSSRTNESSKRSLDEAPTHSAKQNSKHAAPLSSRSSTSMVCY